MGIKPRQAIDLSPAQRGLQDERIRIEHIKLLHHCLSFDQGFSSDKKWLPRKCAARPGDGCDKLNNRLMRQKCGFTCLQTLSQ